VAKVSRRDIAEATLHLLGHGHSVATVSQALAGYLIAERRTRELDSLMRDIETMRYRQDGVLEATVVSARELDASVRETIKKLMNAERVHLHHQINPNEVGGVRVHALDKQLDLSIRSKLKRLKNITTT
jgi:F0F1-type ATP synthase delta subunit